MLRRDTLSLLFLLALTFVFRLPPALCQPGRIDEDCYAVPGLTILRTGLPQLPHFPCRNPRSMFFHADELLYAEPPLYFYLQAGWYAVFSPSYAAARVLSLVVSLVIMWRIHALAVRWTGSPAAGLWAAGLLGLSRWFYYAATIARPDIVCTLFGILAIESIDQWSQSKQLKWLLLCSLWLGLGGLTHPLAVVFAVQCAVWVILAARGWRRIGLPLLLTSVTLMIFSLWLPLILLHPDIFWRQFDNQFIGHHNQGTLSWVQRPWVSVAYHARYLWLNIGAIQMLIAMVPLLWMTVDAIRKRRVVSLKLAGLTWSALVLLSLLVGTHHDVPSYWAYPGALAMLTVGVQLIFWRDAILKGIPQLSRRVIPVCGMLLVLAMLPGSGARLFVEYVRHWNNPEFHGSAVAQELLRIVPADARVAVAGEFLLDFLAAGRPVLGIPVQPIYFELQRDQVDWLVVSRDSPQDLQVRLCAEEVAAFGQPENAFACSGKLLRPVPGACPPVDE